MTNRYSVTKYNHYLIFKGKSEVYAETEMKIERFTKRFTLLIWGNYAIVLGMPFWVVLIHLINGSYNANRWILPYSISCV